MSYLVLEDLFPGVPLEQIIRIEKTIQLESVRLHLLKSGKPLGVLKLTILYNSNTLATAIVANSTFNSIGNISITDYFHGLVLFVFNQQVAINGQNDYIFRLEGINSYAWSSANNIGWIKEYENRIAPTITEPADFSFSPYGIEFYRYKMI